MSKKRKTAKSEIHLNAAEQLLGKAKHHIDKFEYDVARHYCERALELDPDNIAALETLSSVCLEVDDVNKAKKLLNRTIQLSPEQGHSKYMSIAQLFEGKEAMPYYRKGIEILSKALESSAPMSNEIQELRRELSTAYCSVSELFTTDLCDEDGAEEECVKSIEQAILIDPQNPDAYLSKVNYLTIVNNLEEAKEAMEKSLSLWLPHMQAVLDGKTDQVDLVEVCPLSYCSRVNAVKLLIELEMYEVANDIVEALLTENDSIVEVWHLAGILNYVRGQDFRSNVRYYLRKAKKVNAKFGNTDPEIMEQVEKILEDIGPGNSDDDSDSDGDDDKENVKSDNLEDDIVSSGDEDQEMEVVDT